VSQDTMDDAIAGFREALRAYVRGDHEPVAGFFSTRDDVTLANPLGPPRRGPSAVMDGIVEGVAAFKEGGSLRFEEVASSFQEVSRNVTPALGYVVQLERHEGRLGGSRDPIVVGLRVTLIFRPEDGRWKIVHRHADPITSPRPISTTVEPQGASTGPISSQ
jgi:ketosteroid isomerase-like protein